MHCTPSRQHSREAVPLLERVVRRDGEARTRERGCHLVLAPVDDARAHERAARGEKRRGQRGQRDDDIGHDVRQHKIIPCAEPAAQARVGENVARADGEPVLVKAVERGVGRRDLGGLGGLRQNVLPK